MTILTNTPQEAYNQIIDNSANNLKGTWAITDEGNLSVTGGTNGSIAMFSQLGALKNFTLEWTSKQLGNSYIHSNLCPILRYTAYDTGTEGGGDNYAMYVYLCNYNGNTGCFNLRSLDGIKSTENVTTDASIEIDSIHTFKLIRVGASLTLYEDDVLICTTNNLSNKPLYLGWYVWFGGNGYPTNFILQNYKLEGELFNDAKYLDKSGLSTLWDKIKYLFATKTEVGAKADDSSVVHTSGNETIDGIKTFSNRLKSYYDMSGIFYINPLNTEVYNLDINAETGLPNNGYTFSWTTTCYDPMFYTGIYTALLKSGEINTSLRAYKYKDSSKRSDIAVGYINSDIDNASYARFNCSRVIPISNATTDLGTSTNKWKTINGINPGALSLPSMSSINVDITSFSTSGTTIGTFTPTIDGWAILSMSQKNKPFGIWMLTNLYRITFNSVHHNDDYMLFALIPVRASVSISIYCTESAIDSTRKIDWLKIFPCQGNV